VLILNLLFSGLAVGALAFYFLRRRWQIRRRTSCIIAIAAGIFTNPMVIALLCDFAGA